MAFRVPCLQTCSPAPGSGKLEIVDRPTIEAWSFSGHAIRQMFARRISVDEVQEVAVKGETIAEYPEDTPYPSELLLGFLGGRPIHIVFAYDNVTGTGHVVTAYVPDARIWEPDFRTRRKP